MPGDERILCFINLNNNRSKMFFIILFSDNSIGTQHVPILFALHIGTYNYFVYCNIIFNGAQYNKKCATGYNP